MTAQVGDILILGRKRMEMAFCPEIPKHHPRVVEVSYDEARLDDSITCWRIAEQVKSDAIRERLDLGQGRDANIKFLPLNVNGCPEFPSVLLLSRPEVQ